MPTKTSNKKKSVSFATKVKKVLTKVSEPKHYVWNQSFTGATNVLYNVNMLSPLNQGTSNVTRIGDLIHLEALKLNATFWNLTGYDMTHLFRVIIFRHDDFYNVNTLTTSFNSAYTNILLNSAGGTNSSWVDGCIDAKQAHVIYDKVHTVTPIAANLAGARNLKVTIPLKMKAQFKTGSKELTKGNWYIAYANFTPNGTSILNTHEMDMTFDLIFKDID